MQHALQEALDYSVAMTRHNMATIEDFPERCEGDSWLCMNQKLDPPARNHWIDGFWVGLLWLAYAHTDDSTIATAAREWSDRLAWLRTSTDTHDLGFIFYLSHVLGGRITDDSSLFDNAIEAAETHIKRYNPYGEYLQAWGAIDGPAHDRGRTNVDLMMNLALLFWCTEHTGDPRYARIAEYHARTSRFVLVRPDDSTVHVADFDPETGAFLKHATHQGLSEASCWSRGHAWAVYGFTEAYQYTGIPAFLTVARRLSHYAIREAPPDLIPYWDYDSPDIPNTFRDTSAAAVLAAALLELATCESDENEQKRWYDYAEALLLSLWQNYSTRGSTMPAILSQGSRSVPHGMANHALIYGDYYFVQALTKLLRPDLAERTFSPPVSPQVM